MNNKYSAQNIFASMQESMKAAMEIAPTTPAFDMKTAMEIQRKNMQAITDVNQTVMNGWQELARRQAAMMAEFIQSNSAIAKDITAEDMIHRQTDVIKNVCQKSMANSQELIEMMRQNNLQTAEVISERLMNSMNEIKNSVKSDA